jgi:glutathione S-transferase
MRARMALLLNKQPFIVREVDLKNKPEELLEISPKGTVPVMVLPDGSVLEESMHIMHWAFDQEEEINPRRFRENEILVIEQLISENDGPFKHILDRYKYPENYSDEPVRDWRQESDKFLGKLEMFLKHNTYLFGDKPAIEDLAIMPFVRQFRMVDTEWFDKESSYNNTKVWLNNWLEDDVFTRVMDKYTPWQKNDEKMVFKP